MFLMNKKKTKIRFTIIINKKKVKVVFFNMFATIRHNIKFYMKNFKLFLLNLMNTLCRRHKNLKVYYILCSVTFFYFFNNFQSNKKVKTKNKTLIFFMISLEAINEIVLFICYIEFKFFSQ